MTPNDEFAPDTIDEQIEQLSWTSKQGTHTADSGDVRLVQALRYIYHVPISDADRSSLMNAQKRIANRRMGEKGLHYQNISQDREDVNDFIQHTAKYPKKTAFVRILSSLAAVLVVGALIGSWILVTHMTSNQQTTQTKPIVSIKKPGEPLGTIQMFNNSIGWAVTSSNHQVLRTIDGGISWKNVTPPYAHTDQNASMVEDFLNASLAWIALAPANGSPPIQVLHTTNGGQTWQSLLVSSENVGQITFINAQDGWLLAGIEAAAGPKAVDVFRTTNGGKTWTNVSTASPPYTSPGALPPGAAWLSFFDASNGWAVGSSPVTQFVWLYVTHDGGATWHHQTLPRPAHGQRDIFTGPITVFNRQDGILPTCLATDAGLATGADIYVTHNGGTTWNSTSFLPLSRCIINTFPGPSEFINRNHGWMLDYASTTTTGLYMTTDGGIHWLKLTPGANFHEIDIGELDFISNSVGWAIGTTASNTYVLLQTHDGGRTWTQINYGFIS